MGAGLHPRKEDKMNKTFYTARGELTGYGLACGYIERAEARGISITLWKEHNCYHVRAHNHNTGERLYWNTFDTLTEARKDYRRGRNIVNCIN